MDGINYVKIEEYIKNIDGIYAHKKKVEDKTFRETLLEHSELTKLKLEELVEEKNLKVVFENFEGIFFQEEDARKKWRDLLYNAIYLHDLGKININFQAHKMKNENFKLNIQQNTTEHSVFSAYLYIEIMFDYLNVTEDELKELELGDKINPKGDLIFFVLINAFVISKHHGRLDDFNNFINIKIDNLCMDESRYDLLTMVKEVIKDNFLINDIKEDGIEYFYNEKDAVEKRNKELYIYIKFIFSLMIDSDIYSTYEYMIGKKVENYGTYKDMSLFQNLEYPLEGSIYDNINKYKKFLEGKEKSPFEEGSINVLRSEMLLESNEELLRNLDEDIYYLEAPTGAGKTVTSLKLASEIIKNKKEINKIFYIFPFNTLIEQTKKSLDEILGENREEEIKREIGVINSITPIETEEEYDGDRFKINYEKALLTREFIHYPLVLTSHVKFFDFLFGIHKNQNYPLIHLANSVVILDEIQSYRNEIWREIIKFLHSYSELLNIKFIIMSATLPELSYLSNSNNYVKLIKNRDKYFQSPLFKNRVEVDYSLLDVDKEEITFEILNKIKEEENKLILIEFQFKKEAFNFFELLKDEEVECELLTGDDSIAERDRIITKVKELNKRPSSERRDNFILISTQVIEAGVDIDMDLGFKDISLFDSEEQFLGRINRSCKKQGCKCYFFDLSDSKKVYGGDERIFDDNTLKNEWVRELLEKKNTADFYKKIMDKLNKKNEDINEKITQFNFREIEDYMKLIKTQQRYRVFFNRNIEILKDNKKIILNGREVWDKFIDFLESNEKNHAKKKVLLSYHLEVLNNFTYELFNKPDKFQDERFGICYIDDGEEYFKNGKLDRERLKEEKNKDWDYIL